MRVDKGAAAGTTQESAEEALARRKRLLAKKRRRLEAAALVAQSEFQSGVEEEAPALEDAPVPKKSKKPRATGDAPAPQPAAKLKKKQAVEDRPHLASLSAEEQARCGGCFRSRPHSLALTPSSSALWSSYQSECGGSYLEEAAFAVERVMCLPQAATLQGRLKGATPSWRDTLARAPPDAPCGAPSVLVVSSAALRVLELIRQLPDFHRAVPVAKLFSKHIKVEEQADALASAQVCVAVGTPARLDKLCALGALSLSRLTLLVVDCSRDVKQRSLLDIPETRRDLWALWRAHLGAVVAGQCRVALIE